MRYTTLGQTGIRVSAVGLGCSRLGATTNSLSIEAQKLFLRRAYNEGVSHFDTANIYGQGESERIIGLAFRDCRHAVVIATKAGQVYSRKQGLGDQGQAPPAIFGGARSPWLTERIRKARTPSLKTNFDPDYLLNELQESCRRLSTGYVDLFYLHSPSLADLKSRDLSGFLIALKETGLIKAWGVSCDGDIDIEALLSIVKPDVLQLSYSATSCCRNKQALQKFVCGGGAVIAREVLANAKALLLSKPSKLDVEKSWAAAYEPPFIDAVLCGTGNIEHLRAAYKGMEGQAVVNRA